MNLELLPLSSAELDSHSFEWYDRQASMTNAFAKYRTKNKLSWKDMADLCDLHISQVGYILKMRPSDLERLTIGTAARIKLATGIDLYESASDYIREMSKKAKEVRMSSETTSSPSEMAGG